MNELISELVGYGIEKGLVEEDDKIYVINRLLELFRLDSYTQTDKAIRQLSEILSDMTDYAAEHGLIPENTNVYRDLFDTKIMGILTPHHLWSEQNLQICMSKIPKSNRFLLSIQSGYKLYT